MKKLRVRPNISIREAMKKLSFCGEKCLVITNKENKLLGTLSDGDLRKALLKGNVVSDSIKTIFQKKPTTLIKGKYNLNDAKILFMKNKFDLIPVIDKKGNLSDVLLWKTVLQDKKSSYASNINAQVVIMAGGKGTRMEPFTKVLPKPLVPIHDKPIIEHIIERFTTVGCSDFHITVNYKARILKAYFEELNPKYNVNFFEEKIPLGTAGSLKHIGIKNDPFFVSNCDIIIKTDYSSFYDFHQKGNYDISLVASAKEYIIPYGTCELNNQGSLKNINEKPQYDFLINTGLYILNPDTIDLIPDNKFFHITHLIEIAISKGKKIGVFPVDDDSWIDIGQWAEYKKALEKL